MGRVTVVGRGAMEKLLPHRSSALFIGPVKINWRAKTATAMLDMQPEHYAAIIQDHFGRIPGHFYIESVNLVAAVLALKLRQRKRGKNDRVPVIGKTGETEYPGKPAALSDRVRIEVQITNGPSESLVGFTGQVYILDKRGTNGCKLCDVGKSIGFLVNPVAINESTGE